MNLYPEKIPVTYEKIFEESKDDIKDIEETIKEHMKLKKYDTIFPNVSDLYKSLEFTPLNKVKVVIIGQDPYHQLCVCGKHPRAQGLSFSVCSHDEIPMSLKNIYKEIQRSHPNFKIPNHGNLQKWAEQGVLLLNTSLTVQPTVPGSHGVIWIGFIRKIIEAITEINKECIYVLWGKDAEKMGCYLPNSAIQLISSHPSGFSANKGFIGCGHFIKINQLLKEKEKGEINWDLM